MSVSKRKYTFKKSKSKLKGIPFDLTFEQWCQLLEDAGITAEQIGVHNNSYALARFGDKGGYEIGNCRFITSLENQKERKFKHTEEWKKKHSLSMKGKNLGFKHTEETKAKMKKPKTEEHKRKLSEAAFRRHNANRKFVVEKS